MTNFIIEHQCPQCGAPAEFEETDRLFHCDFCRTNSYLSAPDVFRYALPDHAPENKEIIYFPYWRFKGMLFSCIPGDIRNRFVDLSQQAVATTHFPFSLGFRSQTQKLRFATSDCNGTFIKPELSKSGLLDALNERFCANLPKPILHQAQIGETISLLYAPFYIDEKVMDAILNEPVSTGSVEEASRLADKGQEPTWPIDFLATLCPHCGWDLKGERDALTLSCANCQSTWWPKRGKFEKLPTAYEKTTDQNAVYLPFWRIKADVSDLALQTYADLIRTANLPKVVQPGDEKRPFSFWCPAFKVHPKRFLTIAGHLTGSQLQHELEAGLPPGKVNRVNLPLQEAVEALKLILTEFVRPRQRMDEKLPSIEVKANRFLLVYLPFEEGPHELVRRDLRLAIGKNTLAHAKNL